MNELPDIKHYIIPKEKVMQFMLAGNAHFVLWNQVSGNRFEYRVEKMEDKQLWFVKLCTKHEDILIGTVVLNWNDPEQPIFRYYSKLPIEVMHTKSYQAIAWYIQCKRVSPEIIPDTVVVYHLGNCCKCGRPLNTPESLAIGIGPECLKKL